MPAEDYDVLTPRLQEAVDELQSLMRQVDPLATFQVVPGNDLTGTSLLATVGVKDMELVMEAYMERLLMFQIDESWIGSRAQGQCPARLLPPRVLA